MSSSRLVLWSDRRAGMPEMLGAFVGIAIFAAHHQEIDDHFAPMLRHPDLKATMSGCTASARSRAEGISRSQLDRIITPAVRSWNRGVLDWNRDQFSMLLLVEVPDMPVPCRSDVEARNVFLARLTRSERLALGAGSCAFLRPGQPGAMRSISRSRREFSLNHVHETEPGHYRVVQPGGFIRFEFQLTTGARFLVRPASTPTRKLTSCVAIHSAG